MAIIKIGLLVFKNFIKNHWKILIVGLIILVAAIFYFKKINAMQDQIDNVKTMVQNNQQQTTRDLQTMETLAANNRKFMEEQQSLNNQYSESIRTLREDYSRQAQEIQTRANTRRVGTVTRVNGDPNEATAIISRTLGIPVHSNRTGENQ